MFSKCLQNILLECKTELNIAVSETLDIPGTAPLFIHGDFQEIIPKAQIFKVNGL